MKQKTILFWGELPPNVVHGISISNRRVLSSLNKYFRICVLEDCSSFRPKLFYFFSLITAYLSIAKAAFINKIDFFYVNAPTSNFGLLKIYLSILIVKLFNSDVVVIAHLHRGDLSRFISSGFSRKVFNSFSASIDCLVVLAESARMPISKSGVIALNKLRVLHNTVELSDCLSFDLAYSQKIVEEVRYYCLCNYIESKNLHSLVRIANDINVLVKFNGFKADHLYLERLESLNSNSKCRFHGPIFGAGKNANLKEAKAVILPSLNEGMPLVILESLAYGTPIICYDVGFIKDYLGEDYPGIVKNLNSNALKDKILWLDSLSEEDYHSLCRRSYEIFWRKFSPDKIEQEVLELFSFRYDSKFPGK